MKRILIYLLFVFIIPIAVASLLLSVINPHIVHERRLYALEYCDSNRDYNDIVFIGSSRVRQHINPSIIDSVTNLKAFNLSIDAAEIVECNMLLNKYLQHHPRPRFLFLNMDLNTFDINNRQPFITDYFKYLHDSIVYRCISPYRLAYRNDEVRDYYKVLKFFSTSDMDKNNIILFPGKIKQSFPGTNLANGFTPHGNTDDIKIDTKQYLNYGYNEKGIDLLKEIIATCRKDSIRIAFVFSPYYEQARHFIRNYDSMYHLITHLSVRFNVPFLDYSNLPICDSINYFNSLIHLNARGADIYSRHLAADIKNKFLDSTGQYYQPVPINRKLNNQ